MNRQHHQLAVAITLALGGLNVPSVYADDDAANTEHMTIIGSTENARMTPGSAYFIGEQELSLFAYSDVNRILQQVPGVYLQREEGFGLRPNIGIRGTGTDRNSKITVMEDGVLVAPAPYAAPAAYYFPVAGRMAGIEVLKGPAAIQYGPYTVGGALNLISTPIPEGFGGKLVLEGGEFGTRRVHGVAGYSNDNFGASIESHQFDADGFKRIDRIGRDTGVDQDDLVGKFRLGGQLGKSGWHQLDVKLQDSDEASDQTYVGLTDADFDRDPQRLYGITQLDQINTEHEQQVLRYSLAFSDSARLSLTGYRTEFSRTWYKTEGLDADGNAGSAFSLTGWGTIISRVNSGHASAPLLQTILDGADTAPGSVQLRSNSRDYYAEGLELRGDFAFDTGGVGHELQFGIRDHEDEEDRLQHNDLYHMAAGALVLDSRGAAGGAGNELNSAEAMSYWLRDAIGIGDLTLTPGLRYEDVTVSRVRYNGGANRVLRDTRENDFDEVIPGLGAHYRLNGAWALIAGAHRGFTPAGSEPGQRPEKSWNWEAGVRYADNSLFVEAIGFYNDYQNIVGSCTASSGSNCEVGERFSGDGASVYGLELQAVQRFTAGDWVFPVLFSYTYTDAEFETSFNSGFWGTVSKGDPLPYVADNLFNLRVGAERGDFSTYLNVHQSDAVCTTAACGDFQRTDDIVAIDWSAHYRFSEKVAGYLKVDNLTDEDGIVARQPAGARADKPRTVTLGMKLEF
ncbi:MAG: TonB-dependent receptor [Gammaproteobacteria bacterium]|nr:TonB-dependent receptor [Gammaproteobacteria bacterium]